MVLALAGQRVVEVRVAARVLQKKRNPARRLARGFRHLRGADRFILLGVGAALPAEGVEVFEARSRADRGQRHRQCALRRVEADLQRGIGAHRQPDEMRLRDFEVIEHGERVGVEMFVGVDVGRGRHIRRRVAARGIGDAAMPAREVAHLRLPIGVVGREFVQEDDRRSLTGLFEVEADIVAGDGVGHFENSSRWAALGRSVNRN
jgi:hypothetical protein